MSCRVCSFLRQFFINVALSFDHVLNTFLLGDPNETLSRRIARCRDAGERWAYTACDVLSFIFGAHHCRDSETPGTLGKELWAWETKKPYTEPDIDH